MKNLVKCNNTWKATAKERNAKNENNDCGVRAIASATGKSYDVAHKFAEEFLERKPRKGTFIYLFKEERVQKEMAKTLGVKVKALHYVAKREMWQLKSGKVVKRKPVKGTPCKSVWREQGEAMWTKYNETVARMTTKTFLKEFPKGTYLVTVAKHCFTIKDGVIYGNGSDATKLKARLLQAWEITPAKKATKRRARRKAAPKVFETIAAI